LCGCTTIYNPATQKKEFILIDSKEEMALGRDMDKQIKKELKIFSDPAQLYRLNSIGKRIALVSDRRDIPYQFAVIDDKELNAFAIPGGFVYVNRGLMETATDDELACVVGHEVGHIAARHSVKRLQTDMGYQLLASLALGMSNKQSLSQAVNTVYNLVALGYSRNDELLADRLGVVYAKRANFNPYAMISFLQKLKKTAEKKGNSFNLVFLSSHPPLQQRIKNIEKVILSHH
jgi:predicted Zn-dependent protease